MTKYTLVVFTTDRDVLLERLQEAGLVDVTVSGWEPSEEDRALIAGIERRREAVEYLGALAAAKELKAPKGYPTGEEAFEQYEAARAETAATETEITRYEKMAAELREWRGYDPEKMRALGEEGVTVRYFTAPASELAKKRDEWSLGEGRLVEEIATEKGTSRFVVVTPSGEEVDIDAEEVRLPAESAALVEGKLATLRAELKKWDGVFASAALSRALIEADGEALEDRLQLRQTADSGTGAADGTLTVMEAWARSQQTAQVEAMLAAAPGVVYIKERPTPDDETPVELRNSPFASPFEFIGDLYARPRYGTMDLTRWFAPFFMLFFGMCMGDLGYGSIIFLAGLVLSFTSGKESMRQIGRLTMWCGGAAVVVGFLMGAFFGVSLAGWPVFEPVKRFFISSDAMFYIAIGVGVFQVLFAMVLNVVTRARAFGFRYALAPIGWLVVLVVCIASLGLQRLGVSGFAAGETFAPGGVVFWMLVGLGGALMLLFDNPAKGVLVNFGGGLWSTFNRVTGLLGDALSYIRLFAIGMSGGVLAQVFNRIATEISPDIPVLGVVVTLVILVVGHTLNLFLSTLSAVVHPLRLTFVEFFNNAGFEATDREFKPLKHSAKTNN